MGEALPSPYREPEHESVAYEGKPWYYRKGAVRVLLVLELCCAAFIVIGGVFAPRALLLVLLASGVYAVGATIVMVALLRRMAQRQPTKDEALVAWLLLGPCLLFSGAVGALLANPDLLGPIR
ncbi:MAG TPA: hypothetical protein VG389_25435 [Myxococcota bacterium]|jgi:hypothetical protein|nr:hypothetical protein [Myxococcota bacterium]